MGLKEKKENRENNKKSTRKKLTFKSIVGNINGKHMRNGSYSMVMTVIFVAVIIVINMIVGELPSKYTQFDVSSSKLYTISDETKEMLHDLDKDVTIYQIAQSGSEDENISQLLGRYEDESKHVRVELKDPVVNPKFVSEYTSDKLSSNSLIVVCGDRNKVIDYNNIYESTLNYNTYSYETTGFDGEGQITSAIDYVTSDTLPKLYTLTGHDEASLSDTLTSQIEKENIDIEELNLVTSESVPDDADCLMINGPQKDITADEKDRILSYMENGGHVLIFTDYTETDMPNLAELLNNYGLSTSAGLIFEGNSQYYYPGYPSYLIPRIQSADAVGSMTSKDLVLMPYAQNINISDDVRSTVTTEALLQTSSKSYIKTDLKNLTTTEKASGDEEGPFTVGAAVTENYNDVETKLVYFSSSAILDENMNQAVSGGNYELISNVMSWMIDKEENISIPTKSLSTTYLTVTAADAGFWGAVVILIPAALVIGGGVVWFRRRRK